MMLLGILAQRVVAAFVNLVTNGDFAQGNSGWTARKYNSSGAYGDGGAGTDVTFASGSAALNRIGTRQAYSSGVVRQAIVSLQAGSSYRVELDYSAPATPIRSFVVLGGQSFNFAAQNAAGHLTATVVAGSTNSFIDVDFTAAANGTAVTVDNIQVTPL